MYSYATLAQINATRTKKGEATNETEDVKLLNLARQVTARFENIAWTPSFMPRVETRYYNGVGDHIQKGGVFLDLDTPFLSVSSVSVGGAALASSGYVVVPRTETPIYRLRRVDSTWSTGWATQYDAIAVTGVTGYHSTYAKAWRDSGDTLQSNIDDSASTTTLSVGNADGADTLAQSPRFSEGQVIRLTNGSDETEYMVVLAIDTAANTLTVERGALGTNPVVHTSTTKPYTWQVQADIVRATAYQVGLMYSKQGSFAQVEFDTMSSGRIESKPPDIAPEAWNIIKRYQRYRFYSV